MILLGPIIASSVDGAYLAACEVYVASYDYAILDVEFRNMPLADGNYAVIGSFAEDAIVNDTRIIEINGGSGVFSGNRSGIVVYAPIVFSLVTPNTWERPWYPATEGNESDFGNMQNFSIPLALDGQRYRVLVDGSSSPAAITIFSAGVTEPTATMSLTPSAYTLYPEGTVQLSASFLPADPSRPVFWSSDNYSVTVDQYGLVTAQDYASPGTVRISAFGLNAEPPCSCTITILATP